MEIRKKKLFFFLPVFQPWAKCVTSRQQCTTGCVLFTSSKSDVATEYLSRESSLCNRWRYWDWQRHDNSLVQFGCQVCYSKPVNINKHILELSFSIECWVDLFCFLLHKVNRVNFSSLFQYPCNYNVIL